jgi:hypothetical protein
MKMMICRVLVLLLLVNTHQLSYATGEIKNTTAADRHIEDMYHAICTNGQSLPSFQVFEKAYRGYLNLQSAGKVNSEKQILTICDLSLSANENRMWIIDLAARKVLLHTLVAHGQGSGEEYAVKFSNKINSHQTSLGFYVTGNTYTGDHGLSLYLHGVDRGYNNMAYERAIVVHGADYVSKDFICDNERLGRSWGCPAVPKQQSDVVINHIKDSTCLFIYYPQQRYLKSSVWLNKRINNLPANATESFAIKPQRKIVYEYSPKLQAMIKQVPIIRLPLL